MDEQRKFKVYGIGSVVYDRVILVDELPVGAGYPEPGEKLADNDGNFEYFLYGTDLSRIEFQQTGGPVPTALSVHHKFNSGTNTSPTLFANIGNDSIGQQISEDLKERGLRFQLNRYNHVNSPQAFVWIRKSDGARSILYTRGNGYPLSRDDIDRFESSEPFTDSTLLHIDATEPVGSKYAAEKVHLKNGIVYLDTGDFKKYNDGSDLRSILLSADIIQLPLRCARELVSKYEFSKYNRPVSTLSKRELAAIIHEASLTDLVVVTDGINGFGYAGSSPVVQESQVISGVMDAYLGKIEGFMLDTKDENGAGDIFAGSLSYALVNGESIEDSLRIASIIAASSTREFGNQHFAPFELAKEMIRPLSRS